MRERLYSILNITGLSIGIAVALVIFIYLQDDLAYDRYHIKAKSIYRVNSVYITSGKESKFALSPVSIGPKLFAEYPEVKAYTRLLKLQRGKLSFGDLEFYEENLVVADSFYFDIFTTEFLQGNVATCFRSPNSIVISEKLAGKYFRDKDPMGKILILDKTQAFEVTGVIKDLPENVHFSYDALIPVKRFDPRGATANLSLFDVEVYTYLLLPENYDTKKFYDKFPVFYEKHAAQMGKAINQEYKAILQPLKDIHFSKEWTYDRPNGNKTYLIAFFIIGVLVLSLSCINYINLTTARAERRAREIAIKKVLGSKRAGMIVQFLGESLIMSAAAMLIAILLTWIILNFTSFNQLIGKHLGLIFQHNPTLLAGIIIITVLAALLSGIYPAFYLGNIHPLRSLKKISRSGILSFPLRKLLVIVQMTISTGVVIFTLLIDHQISYVSKMDLGIDKENVIIIPMRDTSLIRHMGTIRENLVRDPSIRSVTTAYQLPAGDISNLTYRVETDKGMEQNEFYSIWASYGFLQTLGIDLVSGRDFSKDFPSDFSSSFIVNETLVKKMGWKEPVGKRLQQNFGSDGKPRFDGVVIGVIKDFNYTSLHNPIEPLVLRLQGSDAGQLIARLDGNNLQKSINHIKEVWSQFSDDFPADYTFMDRNFDRLYKKDREQNILVKIFSSICILISVIGLISLVSYTTKNRTREISIRKVYGASSGSISVMLISEILVLVIVSALIAIPVAYYLTEKLLNNFAYKAGLNTDIFLITAVGFIILTVGVVSYNSISASHLNPADSLKHE